MTSPDDITGLIGRLRASGVRDNKPSSNAIYMSICDEAADALDRLRTVEAERDAGRANFHTMQGAANELRLRATRAEAQRDGRDRFIVAKGLWQEFVDQAAAPAQPELQND